MNYKVLLYLKTQVELIRFGGQFLKMDSAHCATDPLRLRPNQGEEIQKLKAEMSKMKEDCERNSSVDL